VLGEEELWGALSLYESSLSLIRKRAKIFLSSLSEALLFYGISLKEEDEGSSLSGLSLREKTLLSEGSSFLSLTSLSSGERRTLLREGERAVLLSSLSEREGALPLERDLSGRDSLS